MKDKQKHLVMIVEAARLYYEHQFSQQQIAQKLHISRPGVSRLLQHARQQGIVKIEIIDPGEQGTQLESQLKREFQLKRVIVVPDDGDDLRIIKSRLGRAAAILLNDLLYPGVIVGISWGTTMLEVARHVSKKRFQSTIIVQLNGGVSRAEYDTHASEVTQKIAESFGGIPYLLPLPAIVDRADVKAAILSDKNITRTLQIAREARMALFTIGSFGYDSVLVKSDYFEPEEVEALLKTGAVGDVCSRIIRYDGTICSKELDARTIGIELAELKQKEYRIAVAGGREKLAAIRAALRGKIFNMLITDEWIAAKLLSDT
jgi:deoxyribonucleoside regulator